MAICTFVGISNVGNDIGQDKINCMCNGSQEMSQPLLEDCKGKGGLKLNSEEVEGVISLLTKRQQQNNCKQQSSHICHPICTRKVMTLVLID